MSSAMVLGDGSALSAARPRFPARAWARVASALVVLLTAMTARGQVENVTPFYVTVERDGVAMQCRIGSASYTVRTLSTGQVLKVDGQTTSMYRVEYPEGTGAFLKAEEGAAEDGGKIVKLTKPSRLMAPNAEGGVSWWYLLDKELEAGTRMTVTKTVKGPDGKDAGYIVVAPVGAKGYVRRDFVRQATQAEIDKLLGKAGIADKPADATKPAETKPATPDGTKPAETKPTTPEAKPADGAKPPEPAPGETKPADGTKPTETTPPTGPVTPPGETKPPEVKPAEVKPTEPAPAVVRQPGRLTAQDAETLNTLYTTALKTPLEQVELDAVIGEFERKIEALKSEPGSERLQTQLGQRVRVLKMRADLQATLRQSSGRSDALKQQADQAKAELARLESLRQYTVVGRLVASSVYDGKQLPLMYRVLSAEPASTRTLAYVAPGTGMELSDKVGKVVGVVGDPKFDESLRLNIVVPTRVEVLHAVPGPETGVTLPQTPAPATPAPSAPAPEAPKPSGDQNK